MPVFEIRTSDVGIGMPEDARMTDFLALIVLSLEYLLNDEYVQVKC